MKAMIRIRYNRERGKWVAYVTGNGQRSSAIYDSWADAMRYSQAYLRKFHEQSRWWINDPIPELRPEPPSAFGVAN